MSFTEWAIKNDRVTYVLVLCLIVGGLSYYQTSPKAEDPGFTIKTAKVVTSFPGASAEQVERLVTDRIEEKVQQLPELDDVESSSRPGVSIVSVNVKETYKGGEMRRIWDGLRRKMEEVSSELPQGVLPPMVNDEFGDVFGTVIAITGEGYDYAELKDVADQVRDAVLQVKDVAKVDYYGVQDERVFIDFIPERLAELNLSPAALQQMLQGQNIVSPGGSIDVSNQRLKVEPTGNFAELDDISNALIRPPGAGTSIRLADIANVRHGYVDPPETAFHVNGTPGLALAVSMESGGNIITMGAAIKELVGQLSSEYPIGLDLKIVTFQADDVQSTIDSFTESLLQAVAVVLVCMLLFLGLRTGMVVASLIPMAMATTFVVMSLMDLGLDKVSLAALIIALGLLVDNAVVIAESIMVYMEKGMKPLDAAILSANELRNSLLISSLTTCAAFLPLALADNMMGEFLGPLATVLAITLLGSWALATTAVPLLAVKFLKVEPTDSDFTKKPVYNAYRGILTLCLRHRALFIVGVVGAFFGSLSLFSFLPQKFMSDSALPSFTIELHGAEGTDLEYTEKMTMEIEQWMKEELLVGEERKEGLIHWATYIGNSGPRFYLGHDPAENSPEYAFIFAGVDSGDTVPKVIPKIRSYIKGHYPDLNAVVKMRASASGATPVNIRLRGNDYAVLYAEAEALKQKLLTVPGATNIRDDWGLQTPSLVIDIDDAALRRTGLTNSDVAVSLNSSFDGYQVTEFRDGEELIPTLLRAYLPARGSKRKVPALNVFSSGGQGTSSVPLAQVAIPRLEWKPPLIKRVDGVRALSVLANTAEGTTANEINAQITPWLDERAQTWPRGHAYDLLGEAETSGDAAQAIGAKLYIAGFLFVFLLMLQFNSIRQASIVLLTIPLSLIGIIIGLLVMRSYFGFMALLALLSLAGIVINNGIVLIDRIVLEIKEGMPPALAVIESAQKRFRPILLTTATTVVGLVPLWLGEDPMWHPMAIGLMYGLVFATVLTLALVPVLFATFYRISFADFDYVGALAADTSRRSETSA